MDTIFKMTAALVVVLAVAFFAGQTRADTFAAWQASGVPWGDTLNIGA